MILQSLNKKKKVVWLEENGQMISMVIHSRVEEENRVSISCISKNNDSFPLLVKKRFLPSY